MVWFEAENTEGNKHLINVNAVSDVIFHEGTDLTEIVFIRSAYPSVYLRGNKIKEIRKFILTSAENNVCRIGE